MRQSRPGYKSSAKLARNLMKLRVFNNAKKSHLETQQHFKQENLNIKVENSCLKIEMETINYQLNQERKNKVSFKENLRKKCSQEMEAALSSQKDYFSKKHIKILKHHSEKLKEKYERNFNESLNSFKLETSDLKIQIEKLSLELEVSKRAILSAGTRRPVQCTRQESTAKMDDSIYSLN